MSPFPERLFYLGPQARSLPCCALFNQSCGEDSAVATSQISYGNFSQVIQPVSSGLRFKSRCNLKPTLSGGKNVFIGVLRQMEGTSKVTDV